MPPESATLIHSHSTFAAATLPGQNSIVAPGQNSTVANRDGEFFPWHALADLPIEAAPNEPPDAFVAWAQESHRIAVEQVYGRLPPPGPDRVVRLSSPMLDAWWAAAQIRVAVAASRLAALINAR